MHKTTVNLGRYLRRAPIDPAWIVVSVFLLAAFASALSRVLPSRASAQPAEPTPALMIMFATAHPTQPPTQPTPDQRVYAELAALRARVAELEAERQQPIVVTYQEQPAIEIAPPTPAPPVATEAPAPPDAPADQGPGGSGKMIAPTFAPIGAPAAGSDADRLCAAAAAAGHVSCATPPVLDQHDPRCTGAADGRVAANCEGMDAALLRMAEDR